MKRTISIGSIIALFAMAMGISITVYSSASTPAKLAMFAIGVMAGILIGRYMSQRTSTSPA